jgi:hypothetical protein
MVSIDAKEQCLVSQLYHRICAGHFYEPDVAALLILLRRHAEKYSPVRELSDFIAHREKDRGTLKTYMDDVVRYIRKRTQRVSTNPIHSATDFKYSLNATLIAFNLSPLDSNLTNDLLTCIMSLLQDVRLMHDGIEISRLQLGRFRKNELWLAGIARIPPVKTNTGIVPAVIAPVLIVPNTYCSSQKTFGPFPGLVEAKCKNGQLRLYLGGRKVT